MKRTRLLGATATLIGTTIGAGIYGLPFAIAQVGWGAGCLMLIGLGWVTIILNLAFGEVILRTRGNHQLSGYGEIYFGKPGKILGFLAVAIGVYGAMIAYLIQVGHFLTFIFPGGNPFLFSLIFLAFGTWLVHRGLKLVSEVEVVLTTLILALVGIIAVIGWPALGHDRLHLLTNQPDFLVPYGVIMFALAGSAVIPEIEEILRSDHRLLWLALFLGTLIPIGVYLLFVTVVLGVSGDQVTPDVVTGLARSLPVWIVELGAILGILTMSTSFISLGYVLRDLYFRDFNFSRKRSLILSLLPVLIIFVFGAGSFISLLEVTGILMGGLTGGLILTLFLKVRHEGKNEPAYQLPLPDWTVFALIGLFGLGVVARLLRI